MESKLLKDGTEKTWAIVFDTGDEVMSSLESFAKEHGLNAAHMTAIGAFETVELGYFEWERKDYKKIPVNEQVEVLSFLGDVAEHEGEPKLHVHAVLGKRDGSTIGGHLFEGRVRPTLEVIVTETPAHLRRRMDEVTGLPLIDL